MIPVGKTSDSGYRLLWNKKMILIVEDDLDLADTCAMLLEMHGYPVKIVANGVDALKAMARRRPALILTDHDLPLMGGPELCARVRQAPELDTVPVILMSATDPQGIADPAPYNQFLHKPFKAEQLLATVRTVLANARGSNRWPMAPGSTTLQ